MENKDVWLYPGCPCETWGIGSHTNVKELLYFINYEDDWLIFDHEKNGIGEIKVHCYYRPIGTPWDYAPENATYIKIYDSGLYIFYNENINSSYCGVWLSCPNHLKEHTWERPEWAKE